MVSSVQVNVLMKRANAQFLVSTAEIGFTAGGIVAEKANELCRDKKTDAEKVLAIYQFLLGFSYDYELAGKIIRGEIVSYTPNTASVLNAGKGICYDLSALFAAMCRSQGVACKLVKGEYKTGYHAWNEVLCDGEWYQIDMTYSVQNHAYAKSINECVTPLNGYAA